MSTSSIMQAVLPAGGALLGAALAPLTGGLSIGGGAMVGSALGGAASAGIGLFNNTGVAGASPDMINGLARSQATADRLASGQGLSDTVYNRGVSNAVRGAEAGVGQLIGANRESTGRLSPLTIEGIANKMMSAPSTIATAEDKLLSLDMETEVNNLKAGVAANNEAGREAALVQTANRIAAQKERDYQDAKVANMAKAMGGLTTAISSAVTTKTADTKKKLEDKKIQDAIVSQNSPLGTTSAYSSGSGYVKGMATPAINTVVNGSVNAGSIATIPATGTIQQGGNDPVDDKIKNYLQTHPSVETSDLVNSWDSDQVISDMVDAWDNGDDAAAKKLENQLFEN